jgi:outer membrane protein OmpA-like peptidoglycan-associated protein
MLGKQRGFLKWAIAMMGVGFSLSTPSAWAQDRTFTLDRAQLSGAPDDGFMVYRPYVGEKTRFYANAALGIAGSTLRDSAFGRDYQLPGSPPMTLQFPVYLSGGVQLLGRLGLNLHIPFTPLQLTGAEPVSAGTSGITDRHAAMNDTRFDGRVKIWESRDRTTRAGAFFGFTIPTGNQYGFGGDRQATALIGASGEHDFGKFLLAGHLAPHFRPTHELGSSSAPEGEPLYVGSELRYAVGAYFPMRDDRLRLGVELWGTTGMVKLDGKSSFFHGRNTTVEWLAQGRFLLGPDDRTFLNVGFGTRLTNGYGSAGLRALVSIGRYWTLKDEKPPSPPPEIQIVDSAEFHDVDTDGDGYPDDIDECPTIPEDGKRPNKTDGCPAPKDSDKDGIIDVKDRCPNEAEDKDGIDDEDGCPEEDVDGDKVKDEEDKCPREPGPPNKAQPDKNGCPTLTKVTEDGKVTLLQPIEFDRGKATIKPVSYPILQEVSTLLKARENITLSIHGHTDSIGTRDANMQLSKARAAAVMNYLVSQGISKSRLSSDGFGPDKPVDTNATAEGRARNRRVEFVIAETEISKDEAWE